MMYLNRHPQHNPFYAFDLDNTHSLFLYLKENVDIKKKKKNPYYFKKHTDLKLRFA